MKSLKTGKRFSYKDLLYKSLIFIATVSVIVYFLPNEGKFNYQFDINKPWSTDYYKHRSISPFIKMTCRCKKSRIVFLLLTSPISI